MKWFFGKVVASLNDDFGSAAFRIALPFDVQPMNMSIFPKWFNFH